MGPKQNLKLLLMDLGNLLVTKYGYTPAAYCQGRCLKRNRDIRDRLDVRCHSQRLAQHERDPERRS